MDLNTKFGVIDKDSFKVVVFFWAFNKICDPYTDCVSNLNKEDFKVWMTVNSIIINAIGAFLGHFLFDCEWKTAGIISVLPAAYLYLLAFIKYKAKNMKKPNDDYQVI